MFKKNYQGYRVSGMNDHILSLRSLPECYEEVLSWKVTGNRFSAYLLRDRHFASISPWAL